MKEQSSMSFLMPPEGEALGSYLAAVNRAFGFKSDAELASLLELAPGAIANWKRRGAIPAHLRAWFLGPMIEAIAAKWSGQTPAAGDHNIACVIEVLYRTNCDPLESNDLFTSAAAFGGLVALARFLSSVDPVTFAAGDLLSVSIFADRLQLLLPFVKSGVRLPLA